MNYFKAAFVLLACALIVGTAGAAAMDAAVDDVRDSYDEDANASAPGSLDAGEQAGSTSATAVVWLGLAAVPMFMLAVLGIALTKRGAPAGGRR